MCRSRLDSRSVYWAPKGTCRQRKGFLICKKHVSKIEQLSTVDPLLWPIETTEYMDMAYPNDDGYCHEFNNDCISKVQEILSKSSQWEELRQIEKQQKPKVENV